MNKLMVVDDEAVLSTQLEERLSLMGYDVVARASSGEQAIDLAKKLMPDLIIMDIVMPGKIDGIEASRIIKEKFNIPIVFLTAHNNKEFLNTVKTIEPLGYLFKPFDMRLIKKTIEAALDKNKKNMT